MTDVIAEQGAMIDGVANPDITVSRLGGAGHLKNAIAKAIADGTASATASRLGAQGRIYAIAGGGEISPGLSGGTVAWSPSALFASSEVGVWYDPSDLSTMFQTYTGILPVTAVGQSVGLILDKSKGLVLGSELVTNGTFDTDLTGWSDHGSGANPPTVVSGALAFVNTGSFTGKQQTILTTGKFYKVTYTLVSRSAGTLQILGVGATITQTVPGTYEYTSQATQANLEVRTAGDASSTFTVDNISVKEIPGNHALEATTAERPLLDTANLINYDGIDDLLTASNPNLGTDVTIARATAGGVSILTGQTVGANYVDNTDHYGLVIVNRALTAGETASLTTYLEGFIP